MTDQDLPPAYMLAKLAMVMPLFQEARDALTALTEQQRVRHGISKTLAARMDIAGTYSLDDWGTALREGSLPAGRASAGPSAEGIEPGAACGTRPEKSESEREAPSVQVVEPLTDEDWQAIADDADCFVFSHLKQAVNRRLTALAQASAPPIPLGSEYLGDPRRSMDADELQEFCISLSFEQDDYTVDVIRAVEDRMLARPLFFPAATEAQASAPALLADPIVVSRPGAAVEVVKWPLTAAGVAALSGEASALPAAQQPAVEPPKRVFLVPTGEVFNDRETYTRHEHEPPPLCDFETLYASPTAQPGEKP